MSVTRRDALLTGLFGTGMVGLRALATGLPISFLLNPTRARADECVVDKTKAQFVILSTSAAGDPMNANMPNTFDFADIGHSPDPTMAKKAFTLGGKQQSAATPWADVATDPLISDRICFIHHSTLNNSHTNQAKVQRLMGVLPRNEMLMSFLAKQLAPCLGTVQREPLVLGAAGPGESLYYEGRVLPNLTPTGLQQTLARPTDPILLQMQGLRDKELDRLNALLKESGNTAQKAFLDRLANSQKEARSISDTLLNNLSSIRGNDAPNQVIAAATLVAMRVSPVVTIRLPFGGDNHTDNMLANEAKQTVSSAAQIRALFGLLETNKIRDQVTFMAMNVFGRTLKKLGTTGRDHWGSHHTTVVIGKPMKPGVIGGLAPGGGDYYAQAFDSATGAVNTSGDIPLNDSLSAVGKTVAAAVGIPADLIETNIPQSKVIRAALA